MGERAGVSRKMRASVREWPRPLRYFRLMRLTFRCEAFCRFCGMGSLMEVARRPSTAFWPATRSDIRRSASPKLRDVRSTFFRLSGLPGRVAFLERSVRGFTPQPLLFGLPRPFFTLLLRKDPEQLPVWRPFTVDQFQFNTVANCSAGCGSRPSQLLRNFICAVTLAGFHYHEDLVDDRLSCFCHSLLSRNYNFITNTDADCSALLRSVGLTIGPRGWRHRCGCRCSRGRRCRDRLLRGTVFDGL
ncbi:hypothetical protein C7408_13315 [Paraburkholderia caballeronis]|nr:hypothetical protein C7408_13315 [Paraburkholderia caballeronis]TDV07716.1 hypothetical protein C7406_13515 [Paraburkholderia caballeronis]TDV17748.1 hypothetical protein C7404_13516 [Paraburkholderia caballeronis]